MKPFSFQSHAFRLRKHLLSNPSLTWLLDQHENHRKLVGEVENRIADLNLSMSDYFAWKFIRELNLLNPRFSPQNQNSSDRGRSLISSSGKGVHQDLNQIVHTVLSIWFPEMSSPPKVIWLKKFSVRKLAHFSPAKDEIAFSLIFDLESTPAEILHYLAYHELLHRKVGAKKIRGRVYAHTNEFKKKEDQYPGLDSIDQKIEQYILSAVVN